MRSLPGLPHRPHNAPLPEPIQSAFLAGASLLQARRASLMLRAGEEPLLTMAAAIGLDEELVRAVHVPLGEGIAGLVAAQGITFFGLQDGVTFLSLPIVTDRGVEGVLNLSDRLGEQQFSEAHVAPARLLAEHLAQLLVYTRRMEARQASGPDFDGLLARELARSKRASHPFTVVLLEADTDAVDIGETLALVDRALHACLRAYDVVSRRSERSWGIILAPPSDAHVLIADRLAAAAQGAASPGSQIMLRVGVASCPRDGLQPAVLLATAEARMEECGVEAAVTGS